MEIIPNESYKPNKKGIWQVFHKNMGWELLINENRIIEIDGEQLSVIGINWGSES